MPTEKPTLSEQVQELADLTWRQHGCAAKGSRQEEVLREDAKILSEAACLLAAFEQPQVAELLRRAAEYEGGCVEVVENAEALAADLCRWAAALVKLAEARARLAEAEGLPMSWRARRARGASLWLEDCARELEAALTGGESEGVG